jgi:hypothetical protein
VPEAEVKRKARWLSGAGVLRLLAIKRGGEVHVEFGAIEVIDRDGHGVCGHYLGCTEKRQGEREAKDRDFGVPRPLLAACTP